MKGVAHKDTESKGKDINFESLIAFVIVRCSVSRLFNIGGCKFQSSTHHHHQHPGQSEGFVADR